MTLANPPLDFLLWRHIQAEVIRLRSKEQVKKKPMWTGLGEDCISRREPCDRLTGQHTSGLNLDRGYPHILGYSMSRHKCHQCVLILSVYPNALCKVNYSG